MIHALARYILEKTHLYGLYSLQVKGPLREYGWFRSFHEQRSVDAEGNPLPFITYPAIEFLLRRIRPDMSVFEYGSGLSTLWWAARVKEVIACEHEAGWYRKIASLAPSNVTLLFRELEYGGTYSRAILDFASQFDIDSPAELAVLTLVGGAGPRLQALLDDWALDVSLYRRILPLFTVSTAQVLVAGRTSSSVWQYLERETACRVRFFSEERGMQADGRIGGGEARSLVGFYLAAVGVQRFFATLTELADAAFLDSRVILAHLGLRPCRADRFLSDLGRYEEIEDPFLRELTEGAAGAAIPVALGGHSVVSGGLMALIEHAWREHDRALQEKGGVDLGRGVE